jgi:small-conductance mechanosensitive channel
MDILEIVNLVLTIVMGIGLFWLIMSKDDGGTDSFQRNVAFDTRIKKLEDEARYIADQPQHTSYFSSPTMTMGYDALLNAYNIQPNVNEVPINDVVKAIVKHLDMQIEKVAEHTTKKPMEVKVVEKKPSTTITGMEGTTAVWSNPTPPPKPKRKYTKRKAK